MIVGEDNAEVFLGSIHQRVADVSDIFDGNTVGNQLLHAQFMKRPRRRNWNRFQPCSQNSAGR